LNPCTLNPQPQRQAPPRAPAAVLLDRAVRGGRPGGQPRRPVRGGGHAPAHRRHHPPPPPLRRLGEGGYHRPYTLKAKNLKSSTLFPKLYKLDPNL